MKLYSILSLLVVVFIFISCIKKGKCIEENISISGTIQFQDKYCGGAAPSEEILDYYKGLKPLKGYKLYVKKGQSNVLDQPVIVETSTDEFGKFNFNLPKGEYILLSEYQINKDILNSGMDIKVSNPSALKKWWVNGLAVITAGDPIHLLFEKRCNLPLGVPHLFYRGPIAP